MERADARPDPVPRRLPHRHPGETTPLAESGNQHGSLSALAAESPVAARHAHFAAMVDSSRMLAKQRRFQANVHGSPYVAEQQGKLGELTGGQETATPPAPAPVETAGERQQDAQSAAHPLGTASLPAGGLEETDAGQAETEPVAESADEAPVAAEQAPSGLAAAPVATAPVSGGVAVDRNAGGADVALDFLDAPASTIATGIGELGGRLGEGFRTDADTLTAATPAVSAEVSPAGIEAPKKAAALPKAPAPARQTWRPPATPVRADAPKFVPSGAANPQAAETEAAAKGAQVAAGGNRLNGEIAGAPGEERVQGRHMNATEPVRLSASKALVRAQTTPEMDQYMAIDMPDSFRRQVDGAAAGMFRQSLAGPRAQIENAKAKRDREHADAILNTNRQAEALGRRADEEQAQTVKASRDQIGAEKEKSLSESKAVLAEYDGKVGKEKQSKIDEINAQIASHEKQADKTLADADNKVAAEQQKAEKQKADEERKAEEKKRNRKWWQKIGDFFSDIAKAVAKVVTAIVDALASVVKSIVNAARNLANSIISACTSLVKKLLDTFATIVKGFLDVALAAFPAIRNRLNAAIDKFVAKASEAIDKIADTLKESVNKLCDTLTKIVDFAQNFMVSAIQGAVLMFNAIITGNFADLPRIAFMTACNSLGLPGEELWAIVLKAADQAMEIVKAPVKFLGNLIKAGTQGFGQFVGNIKQHLINGLMGWLMGQVGQTGITLPDKFDGAGIFMVIRQVLGLTYEYVRERAVSIVGEKNVSRAEAVFNYLKRLFTEGPAVLFAELKEKAAEMKDTFVQQIEDWAITTVIQKAVIKVTSMLIPGAGFVQAIYGMWQTLQFFLENIKKIAAVVNSLLDSLASISKGAIGAAANYVEKTLVDTLPLVFTWLAKLIGIDGIGQKIKSIIDKLRTPVNTAVDFLVKGAMKLGSAAVEKVKGGVAAVKDKVKKWWKGRKEFATRDGNTHAVYVEGEGRNGRIVVNPLPKQDVSAFLDKAAAKLPEDSAQRKTVQDDIAAARTALSALEGDVVEMGEDSKKPVAESAAKSASPEEGRKKAEGELEQLAATLKRIMDATGVALPAEGDKQDALTIDAVLAQPPSKGDRTAEQKQAELEQAATLIKRILVRTDGTDEVAAYFPRLIARYRLAKLGFIPSGSGKYEISVAINPVINIGLENVVMQGATLDGLKTNVKWDTGTLGDSTVGVKMVASRLGPDHPQGTPPGSGVQDSLMKQLVTDPAESNENKYIRGHLLNDNLGGLGADYNLFPITGNANSQHAHRVEETVKKWVNINRYWVSYTVEVKDRTDRLQGVGDKSKNFVNSTYHCEASIIHADGSKAHEITADIVSEFNKSHEIDNPGIAKHKELPKVGSEAAKADIKLSTSKSDREYVLKSELYDLGRKILFDNLIGNKNMILADAVSEVDGLGAAAVKMFSGLSSKGTNEDVSSELVESEKSTLTKINKKWEEIRNNLLEMRRDAYESACKDAFDAASDSLGKCVSADQIVLAKAASDEVANAAIVVRRISGEIGSDKTRKFADDVGCLEKKAIMILEFYKVVGECNAYIAGEVVMVNTFKEIHKKYYFDSTSEGSGLRCQEIRAELKNALLATKLAMDQRVASAKSLIDKMEIIRSGVVEKALDCDLMLVRLRRQFNMWTNNISYDTLADMYDRIAAKAG